MKRLTIIWLFVLFSLMCFSIAYGERVDVEDVPYIHQVLNMDTSKFLGHNACGPTSSVMLTEFHNMYPTNFSGFPGRYVYDEYVGFTDKSGMSYRNDNRYLNGPRDWGPLDNVIGNPWDHYNLIRKGAHGYIIVTDDEDNWLSEQSRIQGYLINHGLITKRIVDTAENRWNVIKKNTRAGLPLIANWYGHFFVIKGTDTGINNNEENVVAYDPYGDKNGIWDGTTTGENVIYSFPNVTANNTIGYVIEVLPVGIFHEFPGWSTDSDHPSQKFVDCYNDEATHGGPGKDIFGLPFDNSSGDPDYGPHVHPWPDGTTTSDTIWLQDFLHTKEDGEEHWWQLVFNPVADKEGGGTEERVYPVHGRILTFWHNNKGYENYGPPNSYEKNKRDSSGNLLIVQEFKKNNVVRYIGFNTVIHATMEYNSLAIFPFVETSPNDNPTYYISAYNLFESDEYEAVINPIPIEEEEKENPIPPQDTDYTLNCSKLYKDIDEDDLWNPTNESSSFNYGTDEKIVSWIQIENLARGMRIDWYWYNADNVKVWNWYENIGDDILSDWCAVSWYFYGATISSFGQWKVKIFIDGELYKIDYFDVNINLFKPTTFEATNVTLNSVELNWSVSSYATSYNIYRDGILIGQTTTTSYIDVNVQSNSTHIYGVAAVRGCRFPRASPRIIPRKTASLRRAKKSRKKLFLPA